MEQEIAQIAIGGGVIGTTLVYLAKKSLDKMDDKLHKVSKAIQYEQDQRRIAHSRADDQMKDIGMLKVASNKMDEFNHLKEELDMANMAIRDEIVELTTQVKSIAVAVGKNRPFTEPKKVKKVKEMPAPSNVWVVDEIDHAPYADLDAFMIQLRATDKPRVIAFQTLEVIIKIPANKTNFKVLDNVVLGTNIKVMGGSDTKGLYTYTGEGWMQLKLK